MLVLSLTVASLSACGKNSDEQSITRIEASDAAESKEPTERKYKDNTNESVEAPDRNSTANTDEYVPTNEIVSLEDLNIDLGIFGSWTATDGSYLTIFNSPVGIRYIMYDAVNKEDISGEVTTDNSTYLEIKYLKPVENEPEQPMEEDTEPEEENTNQYASYEEMMQALEQMEKETYETVRFGIDTLEYNENTATMHLVISGSGRTLDLSMEVNGSTPDYSTEDNELAQDMVDEAVIDETAIDEQSQE